MPDTADLTMNLWLLRQPAAVSGTPVEPAISRVAVKFSQTLNCFLKCLLKEDRKKLRYNLRLRRVHQAVEAARE